jgi:hypothetical protein
MSSLGITDVVSELSVELAKEERITVSLRLGLGFLDKGFGVGHGFS